MVQCIYLSATPSVYVPVGKTSKNTNAPGSGSGISGMGGMGRTPRNGTRRKRPVKQFISIPMGHDVGLTCKRL